MTPKSPPLPDLDDEEFRARLKPLEAAIVPQPRPPVRRTPTIPDSRMSGVTEKRRSGPIESAIVEEPGTRSPGVLASRNEAKSDLAGPATKEDPSDSPELRINGQTEDRNSTVSDNRIGIRPEFRSSSLPAPHTSGLVGAAERLAQIERIRGPKRRFEYLIPARVGDALAEDAARQGKSATVRLLEVLRSAGYPVIEEDLIDLRKERRR